MSTAGPVVGAAAGVPGAAGVATAPPVSGAGAGCTGKGLPLPGRAGKPPSAASAPCAPSRQPSDSVASIRAATPSGPCPAFIPPATSSGDLLRWIGRTVRSEGVPGRPLHLVEEQHNGGARLDEVDRSFDFLALRALRFDDQHDLPDHGR